MSEIMVPTAPGNATYVPSDGASLWIPESLFRASSGSPGSTLAGARYPCWALDAAAVEQVNTTVALPWWWDESTTTLSIDLYWSNLGAGAGNVQWQVIGAYRSDGGDLNTGDVTPAAVVAAAPAQNVLKVTRLASGLAFNPATIHYFRVRRDATNGADTLANDAGLIGIKVSPE